MNIRTYLSIRKHCWYLLFINIFLLLNASAIAQDSSDPWRLNNELTKPEWLSVTLNYRARLESLENQFRAGRSGNDQILVQRTNLLTELNFTDWKIAVEVLDSRQSHADSSSPLSNGIVNPLDVLQAYVQYKQPDLFGLGGDSAIKVGRFTMDVGSRRFIARNRFRNTINAFTGIDAQWLQGNGQTLRAFYTLPVDRRPTDVEKLLDNDTESDDQDSEVRFWGLYYAFPNSTFARWQSHAEIFYFRLDENDTHNRPTRNRDLQTFGGRIYKKPAVQQFDYQLETAFQLGDSRSSTAASNKEDLDHFAHFQHAELGYSFATRWSPRLVAQFDYASGDDNPADDDNERFDTLFGARRFDYGPTSIYGAFSRSNLISPGIRLSLKPSSNLSLMLAHRGFWLADKNDAWVAARVQDSSGSSGRFIGQQSEIRLRWDVVPKTIQLEAGAAYLFKQEFAEDAANASGEGDANYFYAQLNFSI